METIAPQRAVQLTIFVISVLNLLILSKIGRNTSCTGPQTQSENPLISRLLASPDFVKFQAVIKSAASAASPRGLFPWARQGTEGSTIQAGP